MFWINILDQIRRIEVSMHNRILHRQKLCLEYQELQNISEAALLCRGAQGN